jgi:predicted DNA-binding transcriptional regulator AlpA
MSSSVTTENRLLSTKETAKLLGLSEAYLAKMRVDGSGPTHVKIGSRCLYSPQDLAMFIAARRRRSTSDVPEVA